MKAETAEELSRVFNAVTTAVNAQESIDRPIASHGMDLFNYLNRRALRSTNSARVGVLDV